MNRVIVIGIDALDSRLLSEFEGDLPNFRRLSEESPKVDFDGVFPPDSPTSWASIYTGLNPARHGIVLFVDPLGRVATMITEDVDDTTIRGKTFWDIAGKSGKRVCVIPHLLGYPVWPVNGTMIGRSGVTRDVKAYPEEISRRYDLSHLSWNVDLFPGKRKERYLRSVKEQISNETRFVLRLMREMEWDLFFVSFGELDPITYSFWNYYDEDDPSYPGRNQYEQVIKDFYRVFDEVIGRILSSVGSETSAVIVSDHGMGSRPIELANVNEHFRRMGWLKLKESPAGRRGVSHLRHRVVGKSKETFLDLVNRFDLGKAAALLLRLFPDGKKLYISQPHIDWGRTSTYLTDQSGIKAYPYGGILVRKEVVGSSNYEKLRGSVINSLLQIKDPHTNERVVKWTCKREDLYSGKYVERYPDIVFELREDYGAGGLVPGPLFGRSLSHNLVPGCHKQHQATLLLSNLNDREVTKNKVNLMDVAPTILDLLDIEWRTFGFDGESILY